MTGSPSREDLPPVCDYENSDYQSAFWDSGGRAYEDGAEAVALRRLLPSSGDLLLEIGAGAGRNTPRYAAFKRVVLMDYSFTQMQQARQRLGDGDGRYTFVAADVYRMPFTDGAFDAATMIRVLHHLADAPLALSETRRVLAPGGTFILEFANKRNLKSILRYALGSQKWSPYTPEPVEFVKLNFDFHPDTVSKWLKEQGFTVQRRLAVSVLRMRLLKHSLPTGLLVGLDSLLQWTGGPLPLSPSVFLRAEAPSVPGSAWSAPADAAHLFRCPLCSAAPLRQEADALVCPTCGKAWERREGIYDFRDV